MKRSFVAAAALAVLGAVAASSYGDTGSWTTSVNRDANVYFVQNGSQSNSTNYNQLLSSWFEHAPSNQNDSFLQLAEDSSSSTPMSVTSATGAWDSQTNNTVFSMTVTGANAPYPYSRFWQPDQGMAWGVTFLNYTYSFTATFTAPATLDNVNKASGMMISTYRGASLV